MEKVSLSKRINCIPSSPTLDISAKAKTLKDVIDLSVGEPDFDTPQNIKKAAQKAIKEGFTRYTPAGGIDTLKEAIQKRFKKDHLVLYKKSEIVVSCGAKHSLYNLAQVLFQKGDEVIIPAPYWVSYPPIIALSGAKPVILKSSFEKGLKIDLKSLEEAVTPKTKAIIINSPCNPSGVCLEKDEMEKIAQICLKRKIWIISDEIYEKIVYDNFKQISFSSFGKKIKENTIVVNGVSKAYSMTGWRIGYLLGPGPIIAAITKLQSQSTSNPTSISQRAAIEALAGPQNQVEIMRKEFEKRRNLIFELLKTLNLKITKPKGAFYIFPDFSMYFGKRLGGRTISNSSELADYLLKRGRVATVPGSVFGLEGYLRLSYAASLQNIKKAVFRIKTALNS